MAINPPVSISNFCYWPLVSDESGGTPTWGTKYTIPGLRLANYNSAAYNVNQYGDGGIVVSAEGMGDQTLEISWADLEPDDQQRLFGYSYANGITVKSTSNVSPYVAVSFQIDLADGKFMAVCYPKVKFTKPSMNAATKEAQVTFGEYTVTGNINNLISVPGVCFAAIRTDDTSVPAATISGWFNNPVYSTGADLNALGVTAIADSGAGNLINITLAKTGGGNFILNSATLVSPNIRLIDSTGALVSTTWTVDNSNAAATHVISSTAMSAGTYYVTVDSGVKDTNGVGCTLYANDVVIS